MKLFFTLLFLSHLISACSTGRNAQVDSQNQKYHEGKTFPITVNGLHDSSPELAAGVVGIAAATSKDYYKSSFIGGECKIKDAQSVVPLPCRNVTVILLSASGKELERRQTDDRGEFRFTVESNTSYFLSVLAAKNFKAYRSGPLERGQKVLIPLSN